MNSLEKARLLQKYNEINNSFSQKLTFHLGANAGFFSEFNNMVFAILYCLQNQIRFTLYSKGGNLAYEKGWEDFFLSFCEETNFFLHKRYNKRAYQMEQARTFPPLLLKVISGSKYLTQDVWNKFRTREFASETFTIPQLGIKDASLPRAAQLIINMIWRYNQPAANHISELRNSLDLPDKYISMHVRAGDKVKEKEAFSIRDYMEEAENLDISKNVFVLTDNYRLIYELNNEYPEWKFWTLCQPSEEGYVHADFIKLGKREKYLKLLKLLASVDICASSDHFIGTYSSGPGNYLGMRMGEDKCTGIDYKRWLLW